MQDTGWKTISNITKYRKRHGTVYISIYSPGTAYLPASGVLDLFVLPLDCRPTTLVGANLAWGSDVVASIHAYEDGNIRLTCGKAVNFFCGSISFPVG